MAEKLKPTLWEGLSKGALVGGVLAGLRVLSLALFSAATADFLATGVIAGAAVGGTVFLVNALAHAISPKA